MPDIVSPQVSSFVLCSSTANMLANTVRLLVHRPDQVAMEMRIDGKTVTLLLKVDPDDIGRVFGKQGRTARSLRVVLSSISSKTGVHFELDIQANCL